MPPFRWHVDVWVILGSVLAAYLIASRRHGERTGEPVNRHARRLFLGGMAVLWVGADWPIHDWAERYLYSMHMVQHLLFTLIAAPLLVAGIPAWLWRDLLRNATVRRVWRFVTRPLMGLIIFNSVLLFTHWPAVVTFSVHSEPGHFALHCVLVLAAIIMWWPVVSPLPEMPPISPPGQMLYLFFQSLAPTIPASFLTFGRVPLYPVYATFPRIWGISALTDQMIAGLTMKLGGTVILWTVIATIFFRWGRREREEGWDALAWRDVDAELRAVSEQR
ncbi:MAG TPA: cytochrome c oxidase assembly protein [Actinomycetota bacterium]|nr:cytochrome c oxidase assembly protein [Actinomycetota bacterium]